MSDEIFPIIEPDGEELFFQNAWRAELPQTLGDTECFDFNAQPNEEENLIVMKLTGQQLTEMLSALYYGAEFAYPEKYLEVIRPLLAATACPPLMEEQECYEYPSYVSFARYTPMNPYIEPNEIPEGYETQPFVVNGENGNNIPNYEHFDVIVPSSAITFDVNWFASISGQLPTIEIMVQGAGKVFLKMLTLPNGGLAVITVDNPPDLLDILAGIVTGADNIIDLNQDLVALPPETAQELIFEVDTVGAGLHTIYIVFLPILDDSLIPIRFGGGFRGVQLCDFVETPDVGITSLRFEDCNLEMQVNGEWTVVSGWENWLDCVPSGGGGSGGANIRVTNFDPIIADATTTNTAFTNIDTLFNITPIYSKMLVIVNNLTLNHSSAGARAEARIVRATTNIGTYAQVTSVLGTNGRQVSSSDLFENIPVGVNTAFQLQMRAATAGTASLNDATQINVTVIEFESADDLFVEDIRIFEGELQKKIAGAWINVVDSFESIIAAIQTTANNALSVANAAAAVNTTQNTQIANIITVNNTQNTRLTNLESDMTQITTIDIPQINLTLADHEARIDVLEAQISGLGDGGVWSQAFDWTLGSQLGWVSTNMTYVNNFGWNFGASGGDAFLELPTVTIRDSRITHVKVEFFRNSVGGTNILFGFPLSVSEQQMFSTTGGGTIDKRWYKVPNETVLYNPALHFDFVSPAAYQLKRVLFLGRGENPFV